MVIRKLNDMVTRLSLKENELIISSDLDISIVSMVIELFESIEQKDRSKFLSLT